MSSFPNAQISILRSGDRRRPSLFLFPVPRPSAGLSEPRPEGRSGGGPAAAPAPPAPRRCGAPGLGTPRRPLSQFLPAHSRPRRPCRWDPARLGPRGDHGHGHGHPGCAPCSDRVLAAHQEAPGSAAPCGASRRPRARVWGLGGGGGSRGGGRRRAGRRLSRRQAARGCAWRSRGARAARGELGSPGAVAARWPFPELRASQGELGPPWPVAAVRGARRKARKL